MENLDLISTNDLLKELEGRFEHMLFYGLKEKLANAGVDKAEGTYRYSGNVDMILGLNERLKFIIFNQNIMETQWTTRRGKDGEDKIWGCS